MSDIGYTDASRQGSGGFCIDPNEDSINIAWRVKWPTGIVKQLISFTNPAGTITNSWNW